jgi:hypothetical protein
VTAAERLHILGIRHHGPGSAASVLDALDAIDPAAVLIEGPADAEDILPFAARAGMRAPVAILIHAVENPADSVFYPFAEYSPEWQALRWALARGRGVRFIDLPVALRPAQTDIDPTPEGEEEGEEDKPSLVIRDPLGALAAAAGESDGETWWNALVEQNARSRDVFPAIADAMTAVRAAFEAEPGRVSARDARREELREAHMRLAIREALQKTEGPVAVICGAWHVPALQADVPAKADRELLKTLERHKTSATWVPWTDTRLAAASGYGAGVISPGWYAHLWRARAAGAAGIAAMTANWQARVAALLRDEGLPAATASVIEAARLAVSLAAVRGFATPGLAEMQDATLAVLCHGEAALLRLIESQLVIGAGIGEIDESVPRMPLLADLERWQKKLRLKPSASEEEVTLDLRSETGLLKSTLLHRLALIAVPWGRKTAATSSRGTFRENWQIVWQPELNVRLAEALRWGSTIEQAAAGAATEAAARDTGIAALAALVEACLLADLADAAERATERLQSLAVNSSDIAGLMLAAAPLANVLRYGTARKIPAEALKRLVTNMAAEICVGLGQAARGLDDEAVAAMHRAMRAFDDAVSILQEPHLVAAWQEALQRLVTDTMAAPFLRGYSARRLHDRGAIVAEDIERALSLALSPSVPPLEAGGWLEGFLAEASQLLLHDQSLFALIDRWLLSLAEEAFVNLLPGLRRALSNLDRMEGRRLLQQVEHGGGPIAAAGAGDARAEAAYQAALPLLKLILGLDGDEP